MGTLQNLQKLFEGKTPFETAMVVSGFTGFRCTKLEDLTDDEAEALWKQYAPKVQDPAAVLRHVADELERRELKSNILALAERTGIKEPQSWDRFNGWMLNRSKFKKHLNAHSIDELRGLYKQLRSVEQNNALSAAKPLNKAWWNKANELKNWN